ncbi:MAG: hypothetical protein KGL39_19345 [Patescibacteria group bacterium]|nr:hypothetical protein [Patescibacteria group bacterium]
MAYRMIDPGVYSKWGEHISPPEYEAGNPEECLVCGEVLDLDDDDYRFVEGGIICPNCPSCDAFGCNKLQAEGSPIDSCLEHTIEGLAEDLTYTTLGTPEHDALMQQIQLWRAKEKQP